ncbi:phosphatases II [Auriscalpium vulgare]|uniref:Phosphatases II n=1 Tax=Auriscalpium vulgare TaxID=40419 RepID=A0ACB8RV49_9AGAM|nr:phosphatases II [Auriscalpium vulgare]
MRRDSHPVLSSLDVPTRPSLDRNETVKPLRAQTPALSLSIPERDDEVASLFDSTPYQPLTPTQAQISLLQRIPVSPASAALKSQCTLHTLRGPFSPQLSEIDDGLFISDLYTSQQRRTLKTYGITHVVGAMEDPTNCRYGLVHANFVRIRDSGHANLYDELEDMAKWIDSAIQTGGRVLVHSCYGVSRSAALVAAYLIMAKKMTADQALAFVRAGRPVAQPNEGFVYQLRVFQREQECRRRRAPYISF